MFKKIILEKTDITNFSKADAIVNAGNETLCGCFTVEHRCLDNQIHKKSGLDLYKECYGIMKGKLASPGDVIITKGYNLPAHYVIHAYGPDCNRVGKRSDLLMKTYENCLEVARKNKLKSIAFPCISTGIYGYPKSEAAIVAVSTINKWLTNNPNALEKIYIIVYDEIDNISYRNLLNK